MAAPSEEKGDAILPHLRVMALFFNKMLGFTAQPTQSHHILVNHAQIRYNRNTQKSKSRTPMPIIQNTNETGTLHRLASIDLHGLSEEQAKNVIQTQLKYFPVNQWEKIRFITGRGNHINAKGQRGTIYNNFKDWINEVKTKTQTVEQFDGYYEITIENENTIYSPIEYFLDQIIEKYIIKNIKEIQTDAAKKDEDAMMALAICYDKGLSVKQDYKQATILYKEIADTKKTALTQFETGCRYFIGMGVRQNDTEAIKYLELSAAQEYVHAEYMLGTIFHKGTNTVPADLPRAFKYYLAAAKHKHPEAARIIGNFYHSGTGVEKNEEEAIKWWQQAETQGDPIAALNLANHTKNSERAGYYLQRSATLRNRNAQFLLGLKLIFGFEKTKIDMKQGIHWITQAAKQFHPDALLLLFKISAANKKWTEAGTYLIEAAEAGEIEAQYHIAFTKPEILKKIFPSRDDKEENPTTKVNRFTTTLQEKTIKTFLQQPNQNILENKNINAQLVVACLIDDKNTAAEIKKGITLLKTMSENNDTWAIFCIAGEYLEGRGDIIKKNPQLGYQYLLKGEKLDDPNCLCSLGKYWAQGLGTQLPEKQRINPEKALKYFERAAKKNNPGAYLELGVFYNETNLPLAIQNYQKALELSAPGVQTENSPQQNVYMYAAINLAQIYQRGGKDVPKDQPKALHHYDIAANNGSVDAAMNLFQYYIDNDDTDKYLYYLNIGATLGDERAKQVLQKLTSNPQTKALVESAVKPNKKGKTALPFFAEKKSPATEEKKHPTKPKPKKK
jgi:TPR repeat protein